MSGEARASKDRVTFDVPWPHEYAQTKSINFQDRDFDLVQLIRGEVSIIHSVEKSFTSVLRQKHLNNLLYLVDKFPFCEIKDFHAEFNNLGLTVFRKSKHTHLFHPLG